MSSEGQDMSVCVYIYIYIYIYQVLDRNVQHDVRVYVETCDMYICICIYMYMYIYTCTIYFLVHLTLPMSHSPDHIRGHVCCEEVLLYRSTEGAPYAGFQQKYTEPIRRHVTCT